MAFSGVVQLAGWERSWLKGQDLAYIMSGVVAQACALSRGLVTRSVLAVTV